MVKLCLAAVAAVLISLSLAPASLAQNVAGKDMIVQQSAHDVTKTIDRLSAILKEKGITVVTRVDHAAAAKRIGATMLPSQVLVFGNPKLGTPLMQSDPTIGIDLPLKALAWQDADGKVWLAYNDPAFLAKRHGITDRAKAFMTMSTVLKGVTAAAAKK
ncbi:MAG: DUF302 domain-containing protein [Proteobacteria bacterium]|nr:DUF302 domain-containing protein [Pseudomonadota bacterium]